MLKKSVFAFILVLLLLTGGISVLAADAGGPNDPLVSLSYARTWAQVVLDSAAASISSTLNPFYQKASANALAYLQAGTGSESCSLNTSGSIKITTGSSLTLISGSASVKVDSGTVVNVSAGAAVGSGNLNKHQTYIACENTSATITAASASVFIVDGQYSKTDVPAAFTDVKSTDWFYSDVYNAVDMGLINGMTSTTFAPGGELTVAQTIKLAACMHQLYNDGSITLQNGSPWYKSYVDYAVENGIIESAYAALTEQQYNASATRREYIHIFYNALPETEYTQINDIADNAIPDVASGDKYAAEIYAFYRAGILTGSGNAETPNWYLPDTNIARREVAAILTRMFDDGARKTFTLL